MQDLIWLLLPVAAASGWFAARRSMAGRQMQGGACTDEAYFKGLNYLLNEQPDKAIDAFVQLLEIDSETVETHLALGNLFRRKGEVERAIRIHQNLIARPALTREQRAQALLELGKDYMRAGLYDRAENLFVELRDMRLFVKHALENLRIIYRQERDWQSCLSVADALEPFLDDSLSLEKSHYFCELAIEARERGQSDKAEALLKRALGTYRDCVRAIHLQADIAMDRGDCKTAIRLLKRAAEKEPEYLPEILRPLAECYKRIGDQPGYRQYLQSLLEQYPQTALTLAIVESIKEKDGDAAAAAFLSDEIKRMPTLSGLLRLIELNTVLPDAEASSILFKLREHLERLLAERPRYQCTHCGFVASTLHWQCPSCRRWSTVHRKPEIEKTLQEDHGSK